MSCFEACDSGSLFNLAAEKTRRRRIVPIRFPMVGYAYAIVVVLLGIGLLVAHYSGWTTLPSKAVGVVLILTIFVIIVTVTTYVWDRGPSS